MWGRAHPTPLPSMHFRPPSSTTPLFLLISPCMTVALLRLQWWGLSGRGTSHACMHACMGWKGGGGRWAPGARGGMQTHMWAEMLAREKGGGCHPGELRPLTVLRPGW